MNNRICIFVGYGLLFSILVGIDRISKYLMHNAHKASYTINKYLSFRLQYNRGISWGMFHSENSSFFVLVTCIIGAFVLCFCTYTIVRFMHHYSIFGELMVCAGALSNMLDRIIYGGVLDFIFIATPWWVAPIFNIADCCIVFGIGYMLLMGFLSDENQ